MRVALTGAALAVVVAGAMPAVADAHSIIRVNGSQTSYLSSDATSLNTLTIRPSGNEVEFADPTVDGGIDPGSCRPGRTDENGYVTQVFCPRSGLALLRIDLGEREDSLEIAIPVAAQVLGGPGADKLRTSDANDVLVGGDGNDEIGSAGGNDRVIAGAGDDRVDGGAGNDEVQAGLGTDAVDGGEGDDSLLVRDGLPDTVVCGGGVDRVDADTVDSIPDSSACENVTRTPTAAPGSGGVIDDGRAPRLRLGGARVQRLGSRGRMRVAATSSEAGTVAASGFVEIGGLRLPVKTVSRRVSVAGGGVFVEPRLTARQLRSARAALRRGRRVRALLDVIATDAAGHSTKPRRFSIRLRR